MPRYKHDCDVCTSLGTLGRYDLYSCPQGGHPTIVARFGDDGPDYISASSLLLEELGICISVTEIVDHFTLIEA